MYLGLDLGTSGLKALVIDDRQAVVAQASTPLEVSRPAFGWSEQDPMSWIAACETVFRALPTDVKAGVKAIGLSGQMHGAVMLDASDAALGPCILWNDTRAASEADAMDADPKWRAITGNIVFPGFTAPKLAWVRTHQPKVFENISKVLLPKDFLRLWLTGEYVSEMSDASGTCWLETSKRDWSDVLLAENELSRAQMPSLVEGSNVSGNLRSAIASEFGFEAIPVAGGGGDNAASAIGMGVVGVGQAFVSLGTSGVLFAANDGYQPDPETAVHTFCHAVPDTWHQMGVILACTDALNWAASLFDSSAKDLTTNLGALRPPGRVRFLPYLGGERTPLASAAVRAGLIGLEHATDKDAVTRAVIEGTCFAFADCRDALSATGTSIERVFAVGGGTLSDYWLQALATALEVPLMLPEAADLGGAFGAARLGMMAETGDASITVEPKAIRTIEPDVRLKDAFREAHSNHRAAARFLKAYP